MKRAVLTGVLLAAICFGACAATAGKVISMDAAPAAENPVQQPRLSELKAKAEQGDVAAQLELGLTYYGGSKETGRNPAEAVKWLVKAAEQGSSQAGFHLGHLYKGGGEGVESNYAEAVKWWRKKAEQGNKTHQHLIGTVYAEGGPGLKKDNVEAYFWLSLASKSVSNDYAAELFDKAEVSLTPEQIAAVKKRVQEWKPASPSAQDLETEKKMAAWHESMRASHKRPSRSAADTEKQLLRQKEMASQGQWSAQTRLGEYHMSEDNGTPDYKEALFWLSLGCNSDVGNYHHSQCDDKLRAIKQHLTPEEIASVQSRVDRWEPEPSKNRREIKDISPFIERAKRGDVRAQLEVGRYYSQHQGKGGRIDFVKAAEWYRKAAESGLPEAQQVLAELYRRGHTGVERNNEEVYFWYGVLSKYSGTEQSAGYGKVRDQFSERLRTEQIKRLDKKILDWKPTTAPATPLQTAASGGSSADALTDDSLPPEMQKQLERATKYDINAVDYMAVKTEAVSQLARYYRQLNTAEGDAKAVKWLKQAAERPLYAPVEMGDMMLSSARVDYANIFMEGRGVPLDYSEAYLWFNLAKKAGHYPDNGRLEQARAKLTPEQIAAVDKRVAAWKPPSGESEERLSALKTRALNDPAARWDLALIYKNSDDYESLYYWACKSPFGYPGVNEMLQTAAANLSAEKLAAIKQRTGPTCPSQDIMAR